MHMKYQVLWDQKGRKDFIWTQTLVKVTKVLGSSAFYDRLTPQ